MVVKTDLCNYTEYKIFPGHGQKFVSKDMKTNIYITKKAIQLQKQKIKPAKLTWTQAWRRMNKKGKVDASKTRQKKKTTKVQKALVGMSLDDIKRKKKEVSGLRAAAVEEAKKEAQKRVQNKGSKPKSQQPKNKAPAQKNVQMGGKKNFNTRK